MAYPIERPFNSGVDNAVHVQPNDIIQVDPWEYLMSVRDGPTQTLTKQRKSER
jgi:hypothetical protein